MDIPVQIAMVIMVIVLVVVGIGTVKNEKHWTDWLSAICCFIGAAFIAYGLYIQCGWAIEFFVCGG